MSNNDRTNEEIFEYWVELIMGILSEDSTSEDLFEAINMNIPQDHDDIFYQIHHDFDYKTFHEEFL